MEATTEPLKVIGYIRVSTVKQSEEGYGLDAQRKSLETYCKMRGYELLTVTMDVVSGGRDDKMYGRQAAIAAIEKGIANALLVRALDRVTRDQFDGAALLRQAARNGWRLLDTEGTDSGEPSQRLIADVKLAVAAEERRKISIRTKEGLNAARQRGVQLGRPSTIPIEVVDRILELREKRIGAKAIATQLTAEGIPAPGGEVWHYSTVRGVLRREGVA